MTIIVAIGVQNVGRESAQELGGVGGEKFREGQSGGADDPRPVRLRKKPSTGQWFLVDIQYLSDIRVPAAEDKWR